MYEVCVGSLSLPKFIGWWLGGHDRMSHTHGEILISLLLGHLQHVVFWKLWQSKLIELYSILTEDLVDFPSPKDSEPLHPSIWYNDKLHVSIVRIRHLLQLCHKIMLLIWSTFLRPEYLRPASILGFRCVSGVVETLDTDTLGEITPEVRRIDNYPLYHPWSTQSDNDPVRMILLPTPLRLPSIPHIQPPSWQ